MSKAKQGDTVKVHYTGKLKDGSVFDSSENRDPLQVTLGKGEVIPGFEEALMGMNVGESKTAEIPADKAYGSRRPDLVVNVQRDRMPPDLEPEVGQYLRVEAGGGQQMRVLVTAVEESVVTLDGNHPLAGEDLTFDIELVEVV